ncbi:MAG: transporter substrate-binding domain-containing protein [Bacteroidales bacterium]|nr:transporter substrate-binding domain-containing protein [Bacteroidales bacterium]
MKITISIIFISLGFHISAWSQSTINYRIMKVGIYDNPPKIFIDNNGNPDGIFIDIIKSIAENEDLQIEYVTGNWAELFMKLENGEIDILPDMAYSKQRDSLFYFSLPVLSSWLQVFTTNKTLINRPEDLQDKRIGVLKASSQEEYLNFDVKKDYNINYSVFTYESYYNSVIALKKNEIDVVVANRFFYFSDLCDKDILPTGVVLQFSELHFAFSKNINPGLIKLFDKNITLLKNNPKSAFYISLQKWFNKNKTIIPSYLIWLIVTLIFCLFVFLLFIFVLRFEVKNKTKILNKKNEELFIAKEKSEINEVYFRSIFENSPVAKSITNLDGSMRTNLAFCELLGYSADEFSQKKWSEITHPDDIQKSGEVIELLLKGEITKTQFEKRYLHKNGSIVFTDVHTALRKNDNGDPLFFITIINDITERKLSEIELKKAKEKAEESDRLKTVFLQNMSHEIRTPMNGILGFIDLLKNPQLNDESKEQYIEIITLSGNRLLNTINDIIEISKIQSNQVVVQPSVVNIKEIMDFHLNFFNEQAERKGLVLQISQQLINENAIIETDNNLLSGILTNLINNAIKFSNKGSIEFGNYLDDNHLVFFVKDTGIGIPADRKEAIFERFVLADMQLSRPNEGSGLGLSIVKAYVEMLKGKIWVESEVDKGSTFFFSIPYKPNIAKGSDILKENTNELMLNKKLTILIAEDDDISYLYLESILNAENINIIRAKNGEEAVLSSKEIPDISLILMDIKMPIMNGIDATRQIRQFNSIIPIIAQTAYAMNKDKEKIIEVGCNNIITKPINKNDLISMIKKIT